MEFQHQIRKIEVQEYQSLRNTTDWQKFDHTTVESALRNDLFSICVQTDIRTIGIGRVIGDGAIYFYVQDVIVHPDFQRLGIGKMIMNEIEKFLANNAPENAFIGLMAAKGVQHFYQQYGYTKRADNAPGMYKLMKKK